MTGVSRVTLYEYFLNKEEIIAPITDGLIGYIESIEQTEQNFYQLQKLQLLIQNYLSKIDDALMKPKFAYLTKKSQQFFTHNQNFMLLHLKF